MGGVHYHAFLPPRTLAPLNDPRTFQPADYSLHVIALPDPDPDPERDAGSSPAEPARAAQPIAPERARGRGQTAPAGDATDASARPARPQGQRPGAEPADEHANVQPGEAQAVVHADSSTRAGTSARGDDTGVADESWSRQGESSGSVPLRRSRRLRSSVHASDLPAPESLDNQESVHAHSYSRLSSSLGSDPSLQQSRQWPPSGPSASVSNLPRWTLPPPSKLTPLSDLLSPSDRMNMAKRPTAPRKRVSLICCVITVTPPIPRQRRFQPRPPRHGDDQLWVASWKVLAPVTSTGDVGAAHPDPASCNVTLYEMCARDWGGQVRRGDVVLLQDAEFQPATPTAEAQLVLSPKNGSVPPQPLVLYRTLPRRDAVTDDYVYRHGARGAVAAQDGAHVRPEDRALRPDLGVLARSDIGVRRVAEMAQWCAEWVGGEGPLA